MVFVYVITSFISIFCVQVQSMIFFAEFHVAPPLYGFLCVFCVQGCDSDDCGRF